MNRLAVFDCDGTLVDSQANICRAMEMCFAETGLAPPLAEATRRVVGLSLAEAMAALHPEGDVAAHALMADRYRLAFRALRAQGQVVEPLFDGIGESIAAMGEAGWLLGVATGKSDRGLDICLRHHGLRDRFITLQTADRHPSKPHPAMLEQAIADAGAHPSTTVMIGDTSYDIGMAKALGVFAIGVSWGYHSPEELFDEGADAVARHPRELIDLLKRFG